MISLDYLEWVIRALSLFNTIALLWLGFTVLLNAERRTLGTWIVGGGLFFSGMFFAGHSTLVGREIGTFEVELEFWWRVVWLLFVHPPYFWYVVIAWYTGVLHKGRHIAWLVVLGLVGTLALALPFVANVLPSYAEIVSQSPFTILSIGGLPLVTLVYPFYSALCILLALSALRRPGASERFMGDIGRQRARPWLIAASFVLLAVTVSVGAFAAWFMREIQSGQIEVLSPRSLRLIMAFDLAISLLLATTTVLLGRAIVSYEIFTGKALPRGGLYRHWRSSLIFAAGYGILVGGSLFITVDPIYRLLLVTVLIAVFYALVSWRSYVEHDEGIERLRPFVASQRLYERLLRPDAPLEVEVATPFRALCEDVLDAQVAFLAALGPLAPLAGPPLAYPKAFMPPMAGLIGLTTRLREEQTICVPLDPTQFGGAVWAVPLWSERGLIGVLLLGHKRDGGLYVQEEVEIARSVGERLIDTQASAEMARRLMALQRQKLAESQVLDHRARRVLHDDILPRLHTALLTLSSANGSVAEAAETLVDIHRRIANLLQEMPTMLAPEVARLGLIGALRQTVDGDLRSAFDRVDWQVEPEAERASQDMPALSAEVVFSAAREAIRNAALHGRDQNSYQPLHLAVAITWRDGLRVVVEDDGVGFNATGPTATGSGQGLVLHSTMMAVIGGTLTVESVPGPRTRVSLFLPQETPTGKLAV